MSPGRTLKTLEPRAGLEPATCRLRIGCSTTELPRLCVDSTIVNFTEISSASHDRCILLTFQSALPSRLLRFAYALHARRLAGRARRNKWQPCQCGSECPVSAPRDYSRAFSLCGLPRTRRRAQARKPPSVSRLDTRSHRIRRVQPSVEAPRLAAGTDIQRAQASSLFWPFLSRCRAFQCSQLLVWPCIRFRYYHAVA